jgi:hypothetical protein
MVACDVARPFGNADFEDRLCQIDRDGRILHLGLLLMLIHQIAMTLARRCRLSHQEESISSLQPLQTDERV